MENLQNWINNAVGSINDVVWGLPTVFLLCGTGIILTILLKGIQFRGFFHAIQVIRGKFDHKDDPGEVNHFQALCTALSATVGLGNIAGVAIAIGIGGPGAVFWMILVGLLGMCTKYSECTLGLMYRRVDKEGVVHGGPMYYIEAAFGGGSLGKKVAAFFALACIFASFGAANMFQTNQAASVAEATMGINKHVTGIVLAVMTAVVIVGGIKRIGKVASYIVPFMGGIYVIGALIIIIANFAQLPAIFSMIMSAAFAGSAAVGGFAGATFKAVMLQGVKRACFSNEAGIGSSPFAHSAAATREPVREGSVAILEPFVDTVIICTMTALVILITGEWENGKPGDWVQGALITAKAFNYTIPHFGNYFIPIAVFFFAYSTLISWSYYGERSIDYLFKGKGLLTYKLVFCAVAYFGAIWNAQGVNNFSEMMMGIMIFPNLIAVILLMPTLSRATTEYFGKLKRGEFEQKD
ncbi:MAG: sodium:alanine symporter family protein [Verrucomicrobiales bacterium]|nr:sodium:alanine symporter family protein [Verrucomicrobiales bacterium]